MEYDTGGPSTDTAGGLDNAVGSPNPSNHNSMVRTIDHSDEVTGNHHM